MYVEKGVARVYVPVVHLVFFVEIPFGTVCAVCLTAGAPGRLECFLPFLCELRLLGLPLVLLPKKFTHALELAVGLLEIIVLLSGIFLQGCNDRGLFIDLSGKYRKAQVRAAVKVNGEMLQFYWSLGRDIMVQNADAKWGSGFLKGLSLDLQKEFPKGTGLSLRNLKYARQWFSFYYQ